VRSAAEGLEPAEVDPKKLRKTAFILVGIIFLGAIVITAAYVKVASNQKDDFRPAFMDELKGHIRLQLADGTVTDTSQIKTDVWLYYQTSFDERDQHEEREKAFALLPAEGVHRVEFFVDIDPNSEEDCAKLAALSPQPGLWQVAAKAKVLEKYLKSEIRFGTVPHEKNGELIYDTSVAVLKRDRPEGKHPRTHVRGEMFDFDRAAKEAKMRDDESLAEGYRKDWFLMIVNFLLNEGDPTEKTDE